MGVDEDRSIAGVFANREIPRTYLIDAEGRLQGVAHPFDVTVETVRALIRRQPLGLPEVRDWRETVKTDSEGRPVPLYEVLVRPLLEAGEARVSAHGGTFEATAVDPQHILPVAWDPARLEIEADLPEQPYEIVIRTGRGAEEVRAAARQALAAALDLVEETELRKRDVLLLTRISGREHRLQPATVRRGPEIGAGRILAPGITLEELAGYLELGLHTPVVDETGLEGEWSVDFSWDVTDPGSFEKAVRETLGLDLRPAVRQVEVTVLRNRER